jgi:hypothetical protein
MATRKKVLVRDTGNEKAELVDDAMKGSCPGEKEDVSFWERLGG